MQALDTGCCHIVKQNISIQSITHLEIPGKWYLLHHDGKNRKSMAKMSDSDEETCDKVDKVESSQLLKTTLTARCISLEVYIVIKVPQMNFGPDIPDCDKAHSLLMSHHSSRANARGLKCNPFCEVPKACWLVNTIEWLEGMLRYQFTCQCTRQYCDNLFLILQPELNRQYVEICHVDMDCNRWDEEI